PLAKSLCFIARARPAFIGVIPVRRAFCLPVECRMTATMLECPVDIMLDVRSKQEFCAGLQDSGKAIEISVTDETALPVATLVPWIGIEEIDTRQGGIRQPVQNRRCIFVIETQVLSRLPIQCCQHLGHAVYERLDPNETGLRIAACLIMQMLATAETNLETHSIDLGLKKRAQILRCGVFDINLQARQKILKQVLLMASQRLAVATAEKISGTAQRMRLFGNILSIGAVSVL